MDRRLAAETIAASMALLELRIWLGPGEEPMGTSSSPVERIATRGFAKTCRVKSQPQEAASAICAAPIELPAGRSLSPFARLCAAGNNVFAFLNRCAAAEGEWRVRDDAPTSSTCSSIRRRQRRRERVRRS